MSAIAVTTFAANESLAEKLRGFGAKVLARRAGGASPRTAENWLSGENGPAWKHTVAMLNDDELCACLLEAAGRGDLARSAETIAALKAALVAEGK
jgi:hypothetical protein